MRNSAFPREDRPYYIHRADRLEIHALRTRARQLAELLGVDFAVGAVGGSNWLFADPAHESFSENVALALLAMSGNMVSRRG